MTRRKVNKDKNKVAGYNTENKNVFTDLDGTYIGEHGKQLTFLRNPTQLLKQYHNLIHKMGRQFGAINMTNAERQDLYAYISEVFVDLVKEFDMSNSMDFPGYIARMLPTRIRGSYLDSIQNYKKHFSPIKNDNNTVEELLDYNYGKPQYTFSYSSKSKYNRSPQRDGKMRGVLVEAVNNINENELDTSRIEIKYFLNNANTQNPIVYDLVGLIVDYGLSLSEAKTFLAREQNISSKDLNEAELELQKIFKPLLDSH